MNLYRSTLGSLSRSPQRYQAVAAILIVTAHFLFPLAAIIPAPWTYLGILPFIAGFLMNYLADKWFHKYETTFNPYKESTMLVTEGLYRYTRNPMYLGFVITLAGLAIFFGSLSPFLVVAGFAVAVERKFIRMEEGRLAEKFGGEWEAYRRRVRRWI
ncbi:MAG: isoprenylcysteine carboxylmethyltransferase family protein [Anaerolineae bacterium]|nr:isoprenylcysteine carboxylmethyltransferase family protein [Anaerolineae bacterium]